MKGFRRKGHRGKIRNELHLVKRIKEKFPERENSPKKEQITYEGTKIILIPDFAANLI